MKKSMEPVWGAYKDNRGYLLTVADIRAAISTYDMMGGNLGLVMKLWRIDEKTARELINNEHDRVHAYPPAKI